MNIEVEDEENGDTVKKKTLQNFMNIFSSDHIQIRKDSTSKTIEDESKK